MNVFNSILPLEAFNRASSVALVANGLIHDSSLIASLVTQYEKVAAVDGGLRYCHEMGIAPSLIIGDFDSIPNDLLRHYPEVPKARFPIDKDETDLELALRAVNTPTVQKIGLFGALEKRLDHALGNLYLMCRNPEKVIIETESETVRMVTRKMELACHPGQTVSLIPFGTPVKGVTTRGLKWELTGATLDKKFMSISNICLGNSFQVEVETGELICCIVR